MGPPLPNHEKAVEDELPKTSPEASVGAGHWPARLTIYENLPHNAVRAAAHGGPPYS